MIRRLFVCMAVLGWVLLLVTGKVEAQCGPNPCYTVNPPVIVHLTPAQAAAQGSVTATLTIQANGGVPSHILTTTPGTQVTLAWTSANGSTAILKTATGGSWSWSLSGNLTITTTSGGNTWTYIVTDANGNSTQDHVNLTIGSGPPGTIIGQDQVPENTYVQINTSGGGASMLSNYTECQLNPRVCINATHTPYTTLTVSNQQSGDSLFHPKHIAGNIAKANESVSYGDSICCIAVSEQDVLSFREDDEVDCSVAGPVPPPPKHQDVQFGLKITYTWVSALTKANGFHPQAPYCSDPSSPPDWPGPFEATANTKSGEYAGAEEMYREVPAGQSFTGVPWNWWFSYISEPYVYPSHPFPPNCTNTDKGFKNGINVFWPLPGMIF